MNLEIKAFMEDRGNMLHVPQPFRNMIAQVQLGSFQKNHEKFFTEMLGDIDTPSLPFGLVNVHGEGDETTTSYQSLSQALNDRLRREAKQMGVSVASLCHLAWAQVISRTSGENRVVFGTILFGRTQSGPGADSSMGLFINTLPLRVDLNGTVYESVLRTHTRLASLLEHEDASLVLAQRCSNVQQGTPLFNSILNYRHNVSTAESSSINPGIEYLQYRERTNYPLTLSVEDYGTELGLTVDVVQPLDPERICGYMQQALQSLTEALDHKPDMLAHQLEVLPLEERKLLLRTWNETQQDFPSHQCIHHLFEQQVDRTPQATALVFMDQSLSYSELNERANRLAHYLVGLGVQPDTLVAICVERSFSMIIGVLAILKAGGAYVPLDPTYPKERLIDILEAAMPGIVVVDNVGHVALKEAKLNKPCHQGKNGTNAQDMANTNVIITYPVKDLLTSRNTLLDHGDESPIVLIDINERRLLPHTNPEVPKLTSRHLAYVMYTSGSTGKPKGVMIEHQGVVNLAFFRPSDFHVDVSSRVLQFTTLSFDLSVSEILMALYSGASLYLLQDHIRTDPTLLWDFLARHFITHITVTPSLISSNTDLIPLETPITFIMGGEALPTTVLRTLRTLAPYGSIINDYGPTEATIAATAMRCTDDPNGEIVSIGRPLANKLIYILDEHGQPVPRGAIGELYIGGVGIARGYLNRLELSSKVFFPDPFSKDPGGRMYKTGDLARYVSDANIEFLGRNDHQVKVRGFRIELGEIEACLVDHTLVDKAAVIATGEGSDKKLVAYVVAKPNDQLVNTLRTHLSSKLPDYMVPAAIVRLDALPLTSNGKLDRKALPSPDSASFAHQEYEEPRGEIETRVASIWAELLHLDRVSRNDNFFALGGHSLLAVRFMNRIAALGVQPPLSSLFASPYLSSFAEY
ncbi:hypothetical protein BGZ65_007562, partial [Modicella reniformis]